MPIVSLTALLCFYQRCLVRFEPTTSGYKTDALSIRATTAPEHSSGMANTGLPLDIAGIIYGLEKWDLFVRSLLKTFHLHVEKNSSVGLQ